MSAEMSTRNTKNEILEAYHALLKKLREQKPVDRQAEKEKTEKTQIVESAAQNSADTIVKDLAELKLSIGKSLDRVEEQLKELLRAIEDPDSELAVVIRKNVEKSEMEAYLRGMRYILNAK